ncbi:MAG: tetratricopeptide repeat protein [Calothrix sp. FI2-JRJ7]|jgi:tetratricopeptide (TPR) repeat protein|nr:tetratricopeptide repeat protein [Calothrix sp. FI2-JRJ7]
MASKNKSLHKHTGFGALPLAPELHKAEAFIVRGQWLEARYILNALSHDYPQNLDVLLNLVNACYEVKDIPGYTRACEMLLAVQPNNADIAYGLAGGYFLAQHFLLALQAFRHALSKFPNHERAGDAAVKVAELEGKTEKLVADIGLAEEGGLEIAILHERGQLYLEQCEYVKARQAEETVLQARPNFVSAYNNLSLISFVEGNLNEAISTCQKVLDIQPNNIHALANLTRFLCLNGQFEDAKLIAQRLKGSSAKAWDSWTKKVEALAYLGDDEGILQIYEEVKLDSETKSGSGLFYHLVAVTMARLSRLDEARDLWKKAQSYLTGAHLVQQNLDDLKKPIAQRHAPWAFSLEQWVTQKTIDQLKLVIGANAKSRDDAQKSKAIQKFLAEHPNFASLIPALLDRGDITGRELAYSLAFLAKTPDMQNAMRNFALSQRGPDEMRYHAATNLSAAGLLPETIRMWLQGKSQHITLLSYEFHNEPIFQHSPEVHDMLTQTYWLMKTPTPEALEQAETILKQALEITQSPTILNNLALCYEHQGRKEEAQALLREVIEQFPDYILSKVGIARGHIVKGELDAALEILKPIMQRKRFHYDEFSAFSNAYIELLVAKKQRDGARAWLKMWERIDPERVDVLKWKDKLEGGLMQRLERNNEW